MEANFTGIFIMCFQYYYYYYYTTPVPRSLRIDDGGDDCTWLLERIYSYERTIAMPYHNQIPILYIQFSTKARAQRKIRCGSKSRMPRTGFTYT